MPEIPLEQVIPATRFTGILEQRSKPLQRLANSLLAPSRNSWNHRHYFQLVHQANELESFLDDYGAQYNLDFQFFRELVASLRGFSQTGHSLSHLCGRIESYGIREAGEGATVELILAAATGALRFTRESSERLLQAFAHEAGKLGLPMTSEGIPESELASVVVLEKLPRDIGVEQIQEEEQRIAEVASKFLLAWQMLDELNLRKIDDPKARSESLSRTCTEEQARVYEATVHNLQSAYDTYIKNTVLESEDANLPALRGLISAALHLLEGTTYLTHFYERHESEVRIESTRERLAEIIGRESVQELILNNLLVPAFAALDAGKTLAEGLLSKFTNAQVLEVDLGEDLLIHARPAALIVGIVNHYGTPVSLEVAGQACNAASILELLLAVGSNPDERRFMFRGDANPLRDIGLLFRHGLGEEGLDALPAALAYLRSN